MRFERAIPILRVFDQAKAEEFYIGYLGFATDWEHRFEPDFPRYAQISRSELIIHLSEHHGDGTPGSAVFLPMQGIREFHAEITERKYAIRQARTGRRAVGAHDRRHRSIRQPAPVLRTGRGVKTASGWLVSRSSW